MKRTTRRFRDLMTKFIRFRGSADYWEKRYRMGGTSGRGSYDEEADFKADFLNAFVRDEGIGSVIEFGCGDGNQLSYLDFPSYTGLDVSHKAVEMCRNAFGSDTSKKFLHISEYSGEKAGLSLSLDVIFHLVEDGVFHEYMQNVFRASEKYVIVYSTNSTEVNRQDQSHVRHRQFTSWLEKNIPEFELLQERKTEGIQDRTSALKSFFVYRKKELS